MADPLFMVQLPLDQRRLYAFAAGQRLGDDDGDDGYLFHAVLAALFGVASPKPFAATSRAAGGRALLAYSSRDDHMLREAAMLQAEPDVFRIIDWDMAAAKPMPAAFVADQPLAFTVRVLPVVRVGKHHPRFSPGAEVDAFLARAEADRDGPKPDRQAIYAEWLRGQFTGGGAEIITAAVSGRRRTTLLRKAAAGGRRAMRQHTDIDMSGTLIVRDPDAFRRYLARGVGRHRAFGFGMLLLKPAGG